MEIVIRKCFFSSPFLSYFLGSSVDDQSTVLGVTFQLFDFPAGLAIVYTWKRKIGLEIDDKYPAQMSKRL